MFNNVVAVTNKAVLTVMNKVNVVLGAGLGDINDHKGESFEDVIKTPVNKMLDLLLWAVAIGGIVSAVMGVIDLKDAMTTEGAPASKKKTAIVKIGFGLVGTVMGLLLQFLGITK